MVEPRRDQIALEDRIGIAPPALTIAGTVLVFDDQRRQRFFQRMCNVSTRYLETDVGHGLAEQIPVLCHVDRLT